MNVSQFMKGIIGDFKLADSKQSELKIGEIVKGTVIKGLPNQEALVNINGVVMKAKLETPLKQGQMTMLQVQPESKQGLLVLKPLGTSQVQITNGSLVDLLKGFGLKDQLPQRQMLQHMHQESIPLTKENINRLSTILTKIPESIPSNQWIQSGIIAMQRGLPLSSQLLSSIHQVLFGKPMDQVVSQLQTQVNNWLQSNPNTTSTNLTNQIIIQLKDGLQQLQILNQENTGAPIKSASVPANSTSAGAPASSTNASAPANSSNTIATSNNTNVQNVQTATINPASLTGNVSASITASNVSSGHISPSSAQPISQVAQISASPLSAPVLEQEVRAGIVLPENITRFRGSPVHLQQAMQHNQLANQEAVQRLSQLIPSQPHLNPMPINATNPVNIQADMPSILRDNAWISNMLKLLGVEHEQQTAKLPDKPDFVAAKVNIESMLIGNANRPNPDVLPLDLLRQAQATPWDSIKSVLMQLSMTNELPTMMKENAQQLLQHITGQQLFMMSDRNTPFSHVTLFLPLYDEEGAQTAAISIQSRKGKRGELDAENCRMIFDLQMKTLGNTLLDVQVTNKIVSLQMHNDHPLMSQLLEEGRESISDALLQAGYHLSSMKNVPYPEMKSESTDQGANQSVMNSVQSSMYTAKPYKGMDIRI